MAAWRPGVSLAPSAITTAASSHARARTHRRSNGPPELPREAPASGRRHRPLLRLPAPQVLELALHSARNEAERGVDAVERPHVVERELAELVRRDRERQVDRLGGARDELDERHRDRDDGAAAAHRPADPVSYTHL